MIWSFRRAILFGVIVMALLATFGVQAQGNALDVERIQRATVFIMQARGAGDNPIVECVGSGTIVSRDGLILANAHNTVTGETCPGDTLFIALNVRLDEPPVLRYIAEVIQADPGLDLALLRITRETDGRLIESGTLALPFVEIGDSSSIELDDTVTVFGYPGIGSDPVAVERGTISGFANEPSSRERGNAWMKTSAAIRGTMSGGGAYNQEGLLVGIPTSAPVRPDAPDVTCSVLQDTNADANINNDDSCVPVGGLINSLRPSNFAQPLLRAAALNLSVTTETQAFAPPQVNGTPSFGYLGFSPSVNEAGMPTAILRSLPSGSDSLYLFFDYANMTPETIYELRVTVDGVASPAFSLSPVRWSGGTRGLWYIGSSGQPFPNGTYVFTLFINGIAVDSPRLEVRAGADTQAEFSDLVFGLIGNDGNVLGNGFVLPTGSIASARFLYRNMTAGMAWSAIWSYNGEQVRRDDYFWDAALGASGDHIISITDPNGLLPGSYRLQLYVDNRLAAISDFTLAGAQEGAFARIFTDVHFTNASSAEEAAIGAPITSFSAGTPSLYALFDWEQIANGTLYRVEWSVDDTVFYAQTQPWNGAENGQNYLMRLTSPSGIPDGTYRVDLFIDRLQFQTAQARVGIGQLPIDQFADPTGIQMRGRVVDDATEAGMEGVSVMLISADFSVSDFTRDWRADQLFDMAITDRDGNFILERPLQRDAPYSIVVLAEGYLPVQADGVEINDETRPGDNSPLDIIIEMTRG